MIEKLPFTQIHSGGEDMVDRVELRPVAPYEMQHKINELVDAVNILQAQVAILEEHAHPTAKTEPADPYAEQRKWIGKVCRFRDEHFEPDCWDYGVLEDIEDADSAIASNFRSSDGYWYDICEPVKPDDDIIYKGE